MTQAAAHTAPSHPTRSFADTMARAPWMLALAAFIVFAVVNAAIQPSFLQWGVAESNLTSFLPLILVAVGQTYVMLAGDIDLSVGSIIALVNVSVVTIIAALGGSPGAVFAGLAAGVGIGLAAGLVNGLLIALLRLQAIVTTFATSIVFAGMALWVLPQAGGTVPESYWRTYAGAIGPVETSIVIFVLALATVVVTARTRWYRHLLATGGNRVGAFQSGLPVSRHRVQAYMLSGLFTAFATLCLVGETASADPLLGPTFTLSSISAVVLGGTALSGGRGSAIGSILGAMTLGLINNIVFFAGIPYVAQDLVKGLIILVALAGGVLGVRRR